MNVRYCVECGDYSVSERYDNESDINRRCLVCNTDSVLPLHIQHTRLVTLANQMSKEFPNKRFLDERPQYRPLNYLIEALVHAKYFIHIVTESTDRFFLGMLALKFFDQDMQINVVVWHPNRIYQDLGWLWQHSRILKGYGTRERIFTTGIRIDAIPDAHQKFIIIDGCIAFEGSANASLVGWTKQGNSIRFTTDPKEIQLLNSTYFSAYMARKRRAS